MDENIFLTQNIDTEWFQFIAFYCGYVNASVENDSIVPSTNLTFLLMACICVGCHPTAMLHACVPTATQKIRF